MQEHTLGALAWLGIALGYAWSVVKLGRLGQARRGSDRLGRASDVVPLIRRTDAPSPDDRRYTSTSASR